MQIVYSRRLIVTNYLLVCQHIYLFNNICILDDCCIKVYIIAYSPIICVKSWLLWFFRTMHDSTHIAAPHHSGWLYI